MDVLIIGGTRFVGYLVAWRLLARGDRVTLFNRGNLPDPFGDRVRRIRGDRKRRDFPRLLEGRRFDATVDFAVPSRESDYDGPLLPHPRDPDELAEWEYGANKRACEDLLADAAKNRFPEIGRASCRERV